MDFTAIRAIVTDIEGTTTPIAFVRDVLFPYARSHLKSFLAANQKRADVAALLDDVRAAVPGSDPEAILLGWMAEDAKVTPLKTLQGLIWADGYANGAIRGPIYPDVPPSLFQWRAAGKKIFVYSSGSIAAQKLIFGHSDAGDLRSSFDGYFDTTSGGKREAESYRRIADSIALPAKTILFLSDIEQELDAAQDAGWQRMQLVRPEDGTAQSAKHPSRSNFQDIFVGA